MPTLLGMRTHKEFLAPLDMEDGLGKILGEVMCSYLHLRNLHGGDSWERGDLQSIG